MSDPRFCKRRPHERLLVPLVGSLLLHLLLAGWLLTASWGTRPPRGEALPVLTVEYLPDSASIPGATWVDPRDFIVPLVPEPEPEPEQEAEAPEELPVRGQIVELPRPLKSERPDQADYLSEHDIKVEQEMASERFRINSPVLAPRYSPTDLPGVEGTGHKDVQRPSDGSDITGDSRQAMRTPGGGANTPFQGQTTPTTGSGQDPRAPTERGRMSYVPDLSSRYNLGRPDPSTGALGQLGGAGPPGSSGSLAAAARGTGRPQGSPSNDYLPNEAKGDATLLNSHEFKYAAFLNKVKRLVSFYADQTLSNATPRQALTKPAYDVAVRAMLNRHGRLEAITIVKSSGIPEFDEALAQAFRLAAPFPDPPPGMVGADGTALLPDFDFHIEIGRARAQMNGIDPRQGVMFPGLQTAPR